jgi:hypothetical protein
VPRAWPRRIVDAKAWVAQAEALGRGEPIWCAHSAKSIAHMAVRAVPGRRF